MTPLSCHAAAARSWLPVALLVLLFGLVLEPMSEEVHAAIPAPLRAARTRALWLELPFSLCCCLELSRRSDRCVSDHLLILDNRLLN